MNAPAMFAQVLATRSSLVDNVRQVVAPVLLQWGDRDNAVDVSGVGPLRKAFPEVTVEIQQGVGHLPMLETPAASIRFFNAFCSRRQLL
jgi:pimeloyl-ACP methyl ester carboxylesterase